jgi:hypothetical protein
MNVLQKGASRRADQQLRDNQLAAIDMAIARIITDHLDGEVIKTTWQVFGFISFQS